MIGRRPTTPDIRSFGITLADPAPEGFRSGQPMWLDGAAAFPAGPDGDGTDALEWHRALFLTCVTWESQVAFTLNLWKDRLRFADDVERATFQGERAIVIPFRFEIGTELDVQMESGRYSLQVSARQYQSPLVTIEVE